MLLSVISMLYFIGGSLAFVFAPSLAENRFFLMAVLLAVLWGSTLSSLRGIKANSLVSTVCFLGGVLIPGILIIVLGAIYLLQGNPSHLDFSLTASNIFPDFKHIGTLVLILAFTRTFTGIEASANHANQVENPTKNFPLSIFIVVLLGLLINLLSAMSVGIVVPKEEISLIAGLMEAYQNFFAKFNIKWIVPVIGFLVAAGAAGGANAWLLGPVKGLLAAAKHGDLPPFFRKTI
jgi:amino acid transporter